ncbi:MAG: carbon-nitrogen hydrolase family protein [Eubacteriales bacterium]|jgi:predicted amidohydrolase|nr:carbon-nitrogen hydrolase family protein [Eubacteriales bacterium]
MKECRVALCQNRITNDKEETVRDALTQVRNAADQGARLVALPEMFVCPYTNKSMRANREPLLGPTSEALSECAAKSGIYLIGGSFSEETENGLYNTCMVFDPCGNHIGTHRKAHLFNVDIPGKVSYKESDTFLAGNSVCAVDTDLGKIGIGICYDIRFPEYFRKLALAGCEILVVPSSFGRATGEAHWILSLRMRAIDNQCYMLGVSPAPNPDLPYQAYGHSAMTDPWGTVMGELDTMPGILTGTLDPERLRSIREEFPLLKSRRPELYV